MSDPFTFNEDIQPVSLPSQNQETESGANATVVGWGSSYVILIIFTEKTIIDNDSSM
jgi:trypsin